MLFESDVTMRLKVGLVVALPPPRPLILLGPSFPVPLDPLLVFEDRLEALIMLSRRSGGPAAASLGTVGLLFIFPSLDPDFRPRGL